MSPIESPWMDAAECAVYLRYVKADGTPDLDRLYQAKYRLGLPAFQMGGSRTLRFDRHVVDEWVRSEGRRSADVDARVRLIQAKRA